MPKWMELKTEFRGRYEGSTGLGFREHQNDFYYLHRIRANLAIKPHSWFRFQFTGQESEAPGFRPPVASNAADGFDLHQGFLEVGNAKKSPWSVRFGRQEIGFGGEHLLGVANWGNTGRSLDGIRLTRLTKDLRLDWFGATLVQVNRGHFNRFTTTVQLHGFQAQSRTWLRKATLELYHFIKIAPREPNELNRIGRTAVYTSGFRADGELPRRFDYLVETAVQSGRIGGDPLRAWAGTYTLGYTIFEKNRFSPRPFAVYSYSTGDKQFGDGRRGTFDQLYPTNHSYFGVADRIAWRNLHEGEAGLFWRPIAKMLVRHEYHHFWLATRKDAFYNFQGRPLVRNPRATSSHVTQEFDSNISWDYSRQLQFVIGYAYIVPGAFLKQSLPGASTATALYLQWRYLLP
jgi:hypothetical protein